MQKSGDYFAGNLVNAQKGTFIGDLALKYQQNEINTDNVAELITYCHEEIASVRGKLEFYLRVPEVILGFGNSILKDDEGFRMAQNVFAQILKKQLNL